MIAAGGSQALPGMVERAVTAGHSGITIADATVRGFPLVFVNAAFEALTGYPAAECLGRSCAFLQDAGTDPVALAAVTTALRDGHDVRAVLRNVRRDDTPFWNELRLSQVRDDAGRVVQVVGVQHDVTELVDAQHLLELERDAALADLRVFQAALSPATLPVRPGLTLASAFVPAEHGVSGDFHLVVAGPRDSTVLVVGDAMGHGLEAARRATFVRTALATFAAFTDDPHRLLELANHALVEKAGPSSDFVTAVCATFEPGTGQLRWSSAGHAAPLALATGRPLAPTGPSGVALGIADEVGGGHHEVLLGAGEGVLMCTDGLWEARPAAAAHGSAPRLGATRVERVLAEHAGESPLLLADALEGAAWQHTNGQSVDDLCLLIARVHP